jgi:hypothetical protein
MAKGKRQYLTLPLRFDLSGLGNKILVGKPEGKRPVEDLGVDGKIISEWTLEK